MPLERERDQAVDEIAVLDARRLEELRIHAGRGEAGDRVQLVQHDLAVARAHEEVDAREAFALGRDERIDRPLLNERDRLLRRNAPLLAPFQPPPWPYSQT